MSPGRGSWWSEKAKNAPATGKRFENHKGMLRPAKILASPR